jgi:hypothetical protein
MMQPSPSVPVTEDALSQEFESIDAYLKAVQEILDQGHMPDIGDLDDRIARLCSQIESAPADLHDVCLAKLDTLLKRLGDCEEQMTAFQTAHRACQ